MKILISGIGAEHGHLSSTAQDLEDFIKKHYDPTTPTMGKLLAINKQTQIKTRSVIVDTHSEIINGETAPSLEALTQVFMKQGVDMSVRACETALAEWGGSREKITHMVSSTCTASSNPGYDHIVATRLQLSAKVEKVLLHGIGCSGGLAGLRLAANLVLAAAFQGKKAVVLVVACEITSTLARLELDRVAKGELNIGVTLFSDGAGAMIVTSDGDFPTVATQSGSSLATNGTTNGHNGATNGHSTSEGVFELLNWTNLTIPDSEDELGFAASSLGWKVILTQRVPKLTAIALPKLYETLMQDLKDQSIRAPADEYDWALHPGGAAVLKLAEQALSISQQHMAASWHVYQNHGNCSSPTVIQVLDTMRKHSRAHLAQRRHVIAAAFGPGVNAEGAVLKKLF